MTNCKKQLTELAQRVMDGEKDCHMLFRDCIVAAVDKVEEAIWWEHYRDKAYLSAIKSLEQELLPDTNLHIKEYGGEYHVTRIFVKLPPVDVDEGGGNIYKRVNATAPTEEAARLAALLLALAEMEEE